MKINQKKAGVLLSYLSMAINSVILILYTPFMIRILGQSEYGLYNLVFSVVSYLGLFSFGLGSAYMRFYSRYHSQDDKQGISNLNGMFITVFLFLSILVVLTGSILTGIVDQLFHQSLSIKEIDTARILMALMTFNIAITFPASVFDSYITAHECFLFQRIINFLRSLLNPFLAMPLLLLGFRSISLVVVTTVLTLLSLGINAWYCFRKLEMKFTFFCFEWELLKEILVFSSYLFLNQIIDQINWATDKFILGIYAGTKSVAVYAVAAQLNTYYLNFSTAISSVFIPKVNNMVMNHCSNHELTLLFTKIGRIQFMILSLIWSGVLFFGKPFISFFAGAGYEKSYLVALLLILPVTIPLIQNIGIEIQRAKNMHKFRSVVYLLIAICNIIISIPLTQRYGESGAAFGTALSLLIGNGFIMNWYYHKYVGLDIAFFWRRILAITPALIPPMIIGILFYYNVNMYSLSKFVLCGIIYTVAFGLSMLFLGMNKDEKNLIYLPIKKLYCLKMKKEHRE